mgnify:CR=1 FL=1
MSYRCRKAKRPGPLQSRAQRDDMHGPPLQVCGAPIAARVLPSMSVRQAISEAASRYAPEPGALASPSIHGAGRMGLHRDHAPVCAFRHSPDRIFEAFCCVTVVILQQQP